MLLAYYTILCHIPSKYGWGKCFLVHHYRVFLNEFLVLMIPCNISRYSLFNGNGHWTSSGFSIGHTKHIFLAGASHHALQFRHSYFTSALPLLNCSGGDGCGGGGRGHCQDGRQPRTSGLHCLWDRRLSASGSSIGQARRKNQNRPRLKN